MEKFHPKISITIYIFTVSQHGKRFHADFQLDLYDVVDRTLVRLSSVFGTNATRFSTKLLGCHQRTAGKTQSPLLYLYNYL